jgi:hypothetical protein
LRAALEESWILAHPQEAVWEARIVEGQPAIRVLIGEWWWGLRLKSAWSGGPGAAYEKIASGVAAGELFFDYVPTDAARLGDGFGGDPDSHSEIMCWMVAWLPREQMEGAKTPRDEPPVGKSQLDRGVPRLEEIDIADLREAVRGNRVSFPSQVPTLTRHARPGLQRKVAQLYFVMGWNCSNIGARYGLSSARVRGILNTWKRRAVKAGYLQQIPPAEVMSERALADAADRVARVPDLAPQWVHRFPSRLRPPSHLVGRT